MALQNCREFLHETIVANLQARNLIRIFFLQERLKNLGKDSDFAPRHVHVIGAARGDAKS